MTPYESLSSGKPFDIRERLLEFACALVKVVQILHRRDAVVLRELKETRFRLRVLRETGYLTRDHDALIAECTELVKITATIIRNATRPKPA